MKEFKYLQKLFFLLVMGFSLSSVCACGDDEEDEPFNTPNQEQTDNYDDGTEDEGTSPTDSIMSPTDDSILPNDSTSGGKDEPIVSDSLEYEHHVAIDLGLSVKWATCNVGASSPEEYGEYFSWGETKTKSSYTDCPLHGRNQSYNYLRDRGIIDYDGLTAAYDAATANWGDAWRMPTVYEIRELLNNCIWEWTTYNGVNGYLVTGPNGNSIFLPAAGHWDGTDIDYAGSKGHYWSAAPLAYTGADYGDTGRAYYLDFHSDYYQGGSFCHRYHGHTIRPVTEGSLNNSEK